jgi:hypothetical protein
VAAASSFSITLEGIYMGVKELVGDRQEPAVESIHSEPLIQLPTVKV